MSNIWKAVIVAILVALVVGVVLLKRQGTLMPTASGSGKSSVPAAGLPKLIDLGSVTCIPCKMMAPILEDLKRERAGKLTVEFIDVARDPAAGERFGIKLIPTQIFLDASGKEFFRHEGFFSKEDILAKFKDAGVDLGR